ncbi:Hsp20/alpha crystallin family protein [Sphaerisporangium sp. TRM90804]|uniref:Hsp20/alpha crystallin family protein n=1 Tax=Sphaerisporangium sp. TRM90804 TaxID=3031113 RepID=UPI00244B7383|nr:Hsp20/alpha crystallin family protein [Sphaerisporangium sp. TRM90804]MDH2430830.1 Hsp20/alpha crystallin family protein [Sphaerisporangium sp. TRM90804]
MGTSVRGEPRGFLPDLIDWLEAPLAGLRPAVGQAIRFEDYVLDGRYVLRAELPGVDPDKDVEITLAGGVLTIRAERQHEEKDEHRSEFRYGSLTRSIALPPGTDDRDVKAVYDRGILEVSVKLAEDKQEGRRILVGHTSGKPQKKD